MPAEPLNRPAHHSDVQRQDTSEPNPDLNQEPEASFRSILFDEYGTWSEAEQVVAPEFFGDLNLDQIVHSIIAGREEYNLAPFFHFALRRSKAACYRQDVFRDLQIPELLQVMRSFAETMRTMRAHLALSEKRYYKRQKQASFLDAVETYCNAAMTLREGLVSAHLKSRGLQGLRDFLNRYSGSEDFKTLMKETKRIREGLAQVRYSLHIQSARVTVDRNDTEGDYSRDVLATFEKFRQADPRSHRFKAQASTEMNHIEAQILDLVATLHPAIFADVDEY